MAGDLAEASSVTASTWSISTRVKEEAGTSTVAGGEEVEVVVYTSSTCAIVGVARGCVDGGRGCCSEQSRIPPPETRQTSLWGE